MAPTGDPDQRLCGLGLWLDAPHPRGADDDVLEQAAAAAGAAERTGLTSVWVVETRAEVRPVRSAAPAAAAACSSTSSSLPRGRGASSPVSYTHLTLPTILRV